MSAWPSSSKLHVHRAHHSGESTVLSKRFSEVHMAISEPVTVARIMGSVDCLKQMSRGSDQLLPRDFKSPYYLLHFYHILSPKPGLTTPGYLRSSQPNSEMLLLPLVSINLFGCYSHFYTLATFHLYFLLFLGFCLCPNTHHSTD